MAVRVKVRRSRQIIVPIRFTRAVTGPAVADAPEVDDRGFEMGTRPGTWGNTDTRGAMISVAEGDTVRVKVLREDIDDSAPLFVVSTNTAAASIAGAAGPLGADGIFQLQGVKDSKNVPVKIQVHLGAADGPVIGELEPHIFQLRQRAVRAHIVTINGTAPARTAPSLVQLFTDVNKVWRPVGIEFLFDPAATRQETINGFVTAGQVTTHDSANPPTHAEFSRVVNLHPDPAAINIYFVQAANEFTGGTLDHDVARPEGYGIVLIDSGNAHDLAHEIGHFLDIPIHAGEDRPGHHARDDIWSERRLMFDFDPLDSAQPAFRNDVGYGNLTPGELIPIKNLPSDPTDGSVARSRARSLNPF